MAETQRFLVRFWGVGGSYPPQALVPCAMEATPPALKCKQVHIPSSSMRARADPPGRRPPASHERQTAVPLTLDNPRAWRSPHWLPFLAPLFDGHTAIDFFGPSLAGRSIEQLVTPIMSPPYFPVDIRKLPSRRAFHTITAEQRIIWQNGYSSKPEIIVDAQATKTPKSVSILNPRSPSVGWRNSLSYRVCRSAYGLCHRCRMEGALRPRISGLR